MKAATHHILLSIILLTLQVTASTPGGSYPNSSNHNASVNSNNYMNYQQTDYQQDIDQVDVVSGQSAPAATSNVPNSISQSFVDRAGGRGTVMTVFLVLVFRTLNHLEMAHILIKKNEVKRFLLVAPLTMIFLGDLFGLVFSLLKSGFLEDSKNKRRLKGIVNLNKLVEIILFVYNFSRVTVFPNPRIPQEQYTGFMIHNIVFMTLAHSFTKLSFGSFKKQQNNNDEFHNSSEIPQIGEEEERFYNQPVYGLYNEGESENFKYSPFDETSFQQQPSSDSWSYDRK